MSYPLESKQEGFFNAARPSVEVMCRLRGRDMRNGMIDMCYATGIYYHEIGEWSVGGFSNPDVIEWWHLPEPGTGVKLEVIK